MHTLDLPSAIIDTLLELEGRKIPGADFLVKALLETRRSVEQSYQSESLWTEGFAVWFAKHKLGFEILEIERDGSIKSPYRRKPKSCDILCANPQGDHIYIETKDRAGDFLKIQNSWLAVYTPQTDEEVKSWLANRVFDCFEKGANLLIARIPVYHPSWRPMQDSDINFEVFSDHNLRTEIPLRLSETPPPHFSGLWIIKNGAEVFYSVTRLTGK